MCEKFKETYRNLAQVLVPLTGKALGEIVRQEKQLVRVKEFLKDYNKPFKTASFVTNCAALKPLFCSKILHCGPAMASNAIEIPSQKGNRLQFFCGVQNAEDGSYELTNLITIQILNFQLDNFVKPEHLEEYFLVPYLCAVDGDPLVLSNYKRKGVHIFDLSASNLAYKVLENVPYQGDRITVCKQLHLPQEHNNLNKIPSVMLLVSNWSHTNIWETISSFIDPWDMLLTLCTTSIGASSALIIFNQLKWVGFVLSKSSTPFLLCTNKSQRCVENVPMES